MAVAQLVIFFVSTVLVLSESSYAGSGKKCNSKDSECLKSYFQSVVREAAVNGIPDLKVPVLDPVPLKDFHPNIAGWYDLQLSGGVGEGLRSCVVDKFWINFDKRYASVDIICDVSVKGHYKMYSNSPIIKKFLNGDTISGDGTGQIKLEKIKFSYDFNFKVEKRGNDYFLNCNFDNTKFDFEILRQVTFAADNLYLGKHEASETVIKMMNQNWKMIIAATGPTMMDGIFKYMLDFTQNYLNNIPTKNYLIDDLSPYLVS